MDESEIGRWHSRTRRRTRLVFLFYFVLALESKRNGLETDMITMRSRTNTESCKTSRQAGRQSKRTCDDIVKTSPPVSHHLIIDEPLFHTVRRSESLVSIYNLQPRLLLLLLLLLLLYLFLSIFIYFFLFSALRCSALPRYAPLYRP